MGRKFTRQQVGGFGWISPEERATWRADDEGAEPFAQECFTCRRVITDDRYWFCAENAEIVCAEIRDAAGEIVRPACRIPSFDQE